MCFLDKAMIVDEDFAVGTAPIQLFIFNWYILMQLGLMTCLGANHNVVSHLLIFLDRLAHDELGLATRVTIFSKPKAWLTDVIHYLSAVSKKLIPQS